MSSNFDWRAEDDLSWDEYRGGLEKQDSDPKRKPPIWLVILVVAGLVAGAGYLGFRQVRQYVENTAESVEEDVLSSHVLVKQAARDGDLELFAPLLSGRDPNWTQDQLEILEKDLLFNRQPFGLVWHPEETADDISVVLSNDLATAEVEYVETYGYGRNGEEGEVKLTQTAIYRLSETRWLLSPPDEDFWGNWISSKGRYVVLTFPKRDEEIGVRLASDLEAAIGGACANLALECSGEPLDVLLATDLDAVLESSQMDYFAGEGQLVLPAPTLVGKPADNVSYRPLYRSYAAFVLSRLIARQAGYQCCENSPFFKALLDVQLHQQGIQSWPLTAADYRIALRQPLDLETIRTVSDEELTIAELRELPDWAVVYLFVEFLASRPEAPPIIDIQRKMAEIDKLNWVTAAGIEGNLNLVEDEWRDAISQKIVTSQIRLPQSLSWPGEDIALICENRQTGLPDIFRYDLATGKFALELGKRPFVVMDGLPNNEGLILTEQFLDVDQLRTIIWRDNEETIVAFGEDFYFSGNVSDPDGRYLSINSFLQESFTTENYLLDLENCEAGDCPLTAVAGQPSWSPNGTRTLWQGLSQTAPSIGEMGVFLGDGQLASPELIGSGSDYFWLDNENFALMRGQPNPALVRFNIEDRTPITLTTVADFATILEDVAENDLSLSSATADPTAPDLIYVIVGNRLENTDYLFSYNWQTGAKELMLTIEDSPGGGLLPVSYSPNHRWLTFASYIGVGADSGNRAQNLHFYNIETGENLSYVLRDGTIIPSNEWSNNGEWLVSMNNNHVVLSAPDYDYDYLILHEFGDCTDLAWIK